MDSAQLQQIISDLLDHVRGMWRYRWLANGIAWALFLGGWLYVSSIPDVYRASTRVFVDTHTLLKPLMRGLTATEDTLDEVQIVSKAVLTRPNLEAVAEKTDLALRAKTPEQMEALVTGLQQRVKVRGGRDNIFSIEYEDVNRGKARDVVAAVLDTFVDNSIGNQGNDAEVTERALDNEIKVHEKRLRDSEEALAKFKQKNLGYMPGEYGDYYNRLETATASVSQTQEKIRLLTERRDALKRQIEGEEPVFGIMSSSGAAGQASSGCSQSGQIEQLQTQLSALQVQYTAKYPRVVAIKDMIDHLEQQCAAEKEAAGGAGATTSTAAPEAGPPLETNPVYQNLKIQLNTAEVDLAELHVQLAADQEQVAHLKGDVDKITEVEAQLKQLTRDYDVVQTRHKELLKRWEDLQAKKRLDPMTDNVQFRRIDPPFASADPVGPNRFALLAGVLVMAIGGGLTIAFGLNQLHPVYFTRTALGRATTLPVLGSISMILTLGAQRRRRIEAIAWGGAYLALLFCSVVAVTFAGQAATLFHEFMRGIGV